MQGDDADAGGDEAHYFFFSAPASPVHYILRSPPSTTAASSSVPHSAAPAADGDCGADFEFGAAGGHGGPEGGAGGGVAMSSAEELFVAGRIRVGCLSPIRQGEATTTEGPLHEEDERDARSPRARRARSASPPRSPRSGAEQSSDPFASASSSSSSCSSSAKSIRRRISLRDLLARTGGDCAGAAADDAAPSSGAEVAGRLGFWPPSIWPSRSSKKLPPPPLPCPSPAPQPGRRSSASSSDRPAKRAPGGSGARRTTSLPYRQGLVLGCLGFGARSYGLARSMHPLSSR